MNDYPSIERLARQCANEIKYRYPIWGMTGDDIADRLMLAAWKTEARWRKIPDALGREKYLRAVFAKRKFHILDESRRNRCRLAPEGAREDILDRYGATAERRRTVGAVKIALAGLSPQDRETCSAFMGRDADERDEGCSIKLAARRLGLAESTFRRTRWLPMAGRFAEIWKENLVRSAR